MFSWLKKQSVGKPDLLLGRSETSLEHSEEITCKPLGVVKLLLLKKAVSFCQSWSPCFFHALNQRFSEFSELLHAQGRARRLQWPDLHQEKLSLGKNEGTFAIDHLDLSGNDKK